jgi:hypothetical protein
MSIFTRELWAKNNITLVDNTFCFNPLPRLKMKERGPHFDTTEVIKAESLAVLDAPTEHDFLDALKKLQKGWEQCI